MWDRIKDRAVFLWEAWRWAVLLMLAVLSFWLAGSVQNLDLFSDGSGLEQVYEAGDDSEAWQAYLAEGLPTGIEKSSLKASVTGAVEKPGVYELPAGSIISDLIKQAGGLTKSADKAYASKQINLAQKLQDGQQIYLPFTAEQKLLASESANKSFEEKQVALVNINTASSAELQTLPGVGPSTAEKIISARPFSQKEDLLNVSGIGESTLAKLTDLISL